MKKMRINRLGAAIVGALVAGMGFVQVQARDKAEIKKDIQAAKSDAEKFKNELETHLKDKLYNLKNESDKSAYMARSGKVGLNTLYALKELLSELKHKSPSVENRAETKRLRAEVRNANAKVRLLKNELREVKGSENDAEAQTVLQRLEKGGASADERAAYESYAMQAPVIKANLKLIFGNTVVNGIESGREYTAKELKKAIKKTLKKVVYQGDDPDYAAEIRAFSKELKDGEDVTYKHAKKYLHHIKKEMKDMRKKYLSKEKKESSDDDSDDMDDDSNE